MIERRYYYRYGGGALAALLLIIALILSIVGIAKASRVGRDLATTKEEVKGQIAALRGEISNDVRTTIREEFSRRGFDAEQKGYVVVLSTFADLDSARAERRQQCNQLTCASKTAGMSQLRFCIKPFASGNTPGYALMVTGSPELDYQTAEKVSKTFPKSVVSLKSQYFNSKSPYFAEPCVDGEQQS